MDPQTRHAKLTRHTEHCAVVHAVAKGEAVQGIGVAGGRRVRPTVQGEDAVDVVGDKANRNKGRASLKNSELFLVFQIFSDVFHDADVSKKL
jgi:hypothetical protein